LGLHRRGLRFSDMASLRRPQVHTVYGRKTIYVGGRRLLLPEDFDSVGSTLPTEAELPPRDPKMRDSIGQMLVSKDIVSERLANAIGKLFSPIIFRQKFGLAAISYAGINLLLVTVFWDRLGLLQPSFVLRPSIWDALLSYLVLSLIVLWHEIGHCAAARSCKIRVDTMGAGFLLIFPALFTKVSLVKLLGRRDRIIVFLGGVYFQLVFSVFILVIILLTRSFQAKALFFFNITIALFNLVPIMKLDGYRVTLEIADKYGVTSEKNPTFFRVIRFFTAVYLAYVIFYLWVSIRSGYHNVFVAQHYGSVIYVIMQIIVLMLILRQLVIRGGLRIGLWK
jgi:Zn-dependent protease